MTDVEILQECRLATMEERALSRQIDRLAMMGAPKGIGSQAIEPAADRKTNNATAGQLQKLEGLIEKLIRKRDENLNIIERASKLFDKIIVVVVIIVKRHVKVFQSEEKPKTDKEIAQEELDRLLQPIEEEQKPEDDEQ